MMGIPFLLSCLYLTLAVAFVVSLLEKGFGGRLMFHTFRRWGKFLLFLAILAILVQVLDLF